MTIQFEITSDEELSGATVYLDGEPYTVSDSHPSWAEISVGLLTKKFEGKEDQLKLLLNPAVVLNGELSILSDRLAFRGGVMYFDGDPMDNALTKVIAQMITEAGGVTTTDGSEPLFMPFVRFAENLYTNPSAESREHLFHFIRANGITITQDGHFLAYKGVNSDRTSKTRGYGIVNGTVYEHANLPNPDGAIVEIPRSKVDANRNVACSVGLHAGDYTYAKDFAAGDVLLNVKINPRDVVSVPSDNQDRKIRVSRYVVLGENTGKVEKAVFNTNTTPVPEVDEKTLNVKKLVVEGVVTATHLDPKTKVKADPTATADVESAETDDHKRRVKKMVEYIKGLPAGTNLRRVRNRTITAKNRLPFDDALAVLGKTLDS